MKVLLIGAGMALAAGMTMGAALHPDLRSDDRPEGPQMFALAGGPRSTGPFDSGMALAAYGANAPDYVVGTDSKKAMAWADEQRPTAQPARSADDEVSPHADDQPTYARAAYDEAADASDRDYPPPYYEDDAADVDANAGDEGDIVIVSG